MFKKSSLEFRPKGELMFIIFWADLNYSGFENLSARDVRRVFDSVKGMVSKVNARNELILKYSC